MTRDSARKRVLLLGAETDVGRACAESLAAAGERLALVSSTPEAEAAFAVQRLARKLGSTSQALDATIEAAVRVMMRQVGKELGGLDATIVCVTDPVVIALAERLGNREMARSGGGVFVAVTEGQSAEEIAAAVAASSSNE